MTYVCEPTEQMSSHQVMTMLLEHANQHQQGNNLITLVELYHPQTGERAHLRGDEVVLRKSDILAAEEAITKAKSLGRELLSTALEGSQQITTPQQDAESPTPEVEEQTETPKVEDPPQPPKQPQEQTLLARIKSAIAENPKTATMLSNELGVSADAVKDAVAAEGSGLINKGGWIKPAA
jgi:hypothetical protein